MELSILIVSYNTAELIKQCIASICTSTAEDPSFQKQIEIIVVDNSSGDDSVAVLRALQKTSSIPITVLANTVNSGFAAANNQAMLHAKGTYVLLLNSDTIVTLGALAQLVQTMGEHETDNLGLLSATLTNSDGSIQPQGGDLPSLMALFVFALLLDDIPVFGKLLPSHQHTGRRFHQRAGSKLDHKGWVAGTALLIRSSLIPQIGVLDEQIFMYAEDIEFCWRAHKAGWRSAIDQSSLVTHLGSQSSSPATALIGEFVSLKYVLNKHLPSWQRPLALFLLKSAARTRLMLFSLLKKTEKIDTYRSILAQL